MFSYKYFNNHTATLKTLLLINNNAIYLDANKNN